jgi:hypothetical protein
MKKRKYVTGLMLLFSFITFGFVFIKNRESRLIEIASNYKTYSQDIYVRAVVTDSSKYKWTIALCTYMGEDVMGYHHEIDSTFISRANDSISPHGNKLYKLFVKDQKSYEYIFNQQPIGQTLVKETWNVKQIPSDSISFFKDAKQSNNDGNWYVPTQVSQLFIMYKEEPNELNDKGWVYGIVDIEGKRKPKVLSQGKISSCISCHQGTKYDRLFGNK